MGCALSVIRPIYKFLRAQLRTFFFLKFDKSIANTLTNEKPPSQNKKSKRKSNLFFDNARWQPWPNPRHFVFVLCQYTGDRVSCLKTSHGTDFKIALPNTSVQKCKKEVIYYLFSNRYLEISECLEHAKRVHYQLILFKLKYRKK